MARAVRVARAPRGAEPVRETDVDVDGAVRGIVDARPPSSMLRAIGTMGADEGDACIATAPLSPRARRNRPTRSDPRARV